MLADDQTSSEGGRQEFIHAQDPLHLREGGGEGEGGTVNDPLPTAQAR